MRFKGISRLFYWNFSRYFLPYEEIVHVRSQFLVSAHLPGQKSHVLARSRWACCLRPPTAAAAFAARQHGSAAWVSFTECILCCAGGVLRSQGNTIGQVICAYIRVCLCACVPVVCVEGSKSVAQCVPHMQNTYCMPLAQAIDPPSPHMAEPLRRTSERANERANEHGR